MRPRRMKKTIKKQLQLFLTERDETALSRCLVDAVPGITFLNDNVWPEHPDCRNAIEECKSGRVYLYLGLLEELPTGTRKDGQLEGPIAGCVIQILRPRWIDGVLLSGRVAVGYFEGDTHMKDFVSVVWKCVKKLGKVGVVRPDGRIDKNYLVGEDTQTRVEKGEFTIADRAIRMPYVPAP